MPIVPKIIAPQKDELFYSWLMRIVSVNHAEYVSFVNHYYFFQNEAQRSISSRTRYDSFEHFANIYKQADSIHEKNSDMPDGASLFLDHTVFSALAPCLNEAQQSNIILNVFRKNGSPNSIVPQLHNNYIQHLQYCPECMKEEMKAGLPRYYHLSHNLPGVKVCAKHHCTLLAVPANKGDELNSHIPLSPVRKAKQKDIDYAIFMRDLAKEKLDINMSATMKAIHNKLECLNYSGNNSEVINDIFPKKHKGKELADFTLSVWRHTGNYMRHYPIDDTLYTLFYLFGSVEEFRNYLPLQEKVTIHAGFTLLSEYRNDLIRVRHDKCGSTFYTSPSLLNDGWGCPKCDHRLTDKEMFDRIFKTEVETEYSLLSRYTTLNGTLTVKHNKCGKVYQVNAASFIKNHKRCSCLQGPRSKSEVQRMLDQQCPGYQIIDYKDMHSRCTIQCPICERTVEYSSPAHFLVRKKCKKCFPTFYEKDDFQKKMKDLVGDEYSLIGDFKNTKTKTTFRHNLCGNTFCVTPTQFLLGSRCSCADCSVPIRSDLLREYIKIRTNGRYSAEEMSGERRSRYLLKDNLTGEVTSPLRMTLLQELARPTPSTMLKGSRPIGFDEPTDVEAWLQMTGNTYFESYEVQEGTDLDRDSLIKQLCDLQIRRKIKMIQPYMDLYVVSGTEIPYDEIIKHYFIMKDGHRIGFYVGKQFLYELGVTKERAPRPSIVTSAVQKDTTWALNKVRYSLSYAKYGPIDDDNWAYYAIMYWLVGSTYTKDTATVAAITDFMRKHHLVREGFRPYYGIMGPVVDQRLDRLIIPANRWHTS